jgi:lysophospholipase L1-like esterase
VPDAPELSRLIEGTGASIQPGSVQTTNSWGLRGPEPDLVAPVRGLVLGDSNAQGMLIGDDETPVACLQRALGARLETRVSLLNTGHIGYSPEQHYFTLTEYEPRFQPQFVLLTLCMNDFGGMTLTAEGLEEGKYWIGKIEAYCRDRGIACYVASFPHEAQVTGLRREKSLPGEFSEPCQFDGLQYVNPVEDIADAHLRLTIEQTHRGEATTSSPLYNSRFGDNHFSAQGAEVWAHAVARRLALLVLSANIVPCPGDMHLHTD